MVASVMYWVNTVQDASQLGAYLAVLVSHLAGQIWNFVGGVSYRIGRVTRDLVGMFFGQLGGVFRLVGKVACVLS